MTTSCVKAKVRRMQRAMLIFFLEKVCNAFIPKKQYLFQNGDYYAVSHFLSQSKIFTSE